MCGIVGIHTAEKAGFYAVDREIVKCMLVFNSLRGAHSTGVAGFNKAGMAIDEVNIVKSVGNPYNLFDYHRSGEFFSRMISRFGSVLGHGRYATIGAVTANNAHPFEEGSITLVHNGGISNWYSLKDYKTDHNVDVDSQLVARLIDREGADAILPKLKGAYALVWYDSTDGSLHMARNDERPLFIAKQKDKETIFFASEQGIIMHATQRNNVQIEDILSIPTFHHVKMAKDDITLESVKKYKPKVTVAVTNVRVSETKKDGQPPALLSSNVKVSGKMNRTATEGADVGNLPDTKVSHELILGQSINVDIVDYWDMPGVEFPKLLHVKGTNENFPNVEFSTNIPASYETDLYKETVYLKGTVNHVLAGNPKELIGGACWRAFLKDVEVVNLNLQTSQRVDDAPPIDDDEDVDAWTADITELEFKGVKLGLNHNVAQLLTPVVDEVRMISKARYMELARRRCAWCEEEHKEHLVQHKSFLFGFYEGAGKEIEDALICHNCMRTYTNPNPPSSGC